LKGLLIPACKCVHTQKRQTGICPVFGGVPDLAAAHSEACRHQGLKTAAAKSETPPRICPAAMKMTVPDSCLHYCRQSSLTGAFSRLRAQTRSQKYAGTAEPFGIAPAEPAAYSN